MDSNLSSRRARQAEEREGRIKGRAVGGWCKGQRHPARGSKNPPASPGRICQGRGQTDELPPSGSAGLHGPRLLTSTPFVLCTKVNHGLSGGEKPAWGGRCKGRSGHGEVRPGLRFQCHLRVADIPSTPGPPLQKAQHRLYVGLSQALSKKTNAEASNQCLAPGRPWTMLVPFPLSLGGEPGM